MPTQTTGILSRQVFYVNRVADGTTNERGGVPYDCENVAWGGEPPPRNLFLALTVKRERGNLQAPGPWVWQKIPANSVILGAAKNDGACPKNCRTPSPCKFTDDGIPI